MEMTESDLFCSRTTRWYERIWFFILRKDIGDLLYLGKAWQIIAKENNVMYGASFWLPPGTDYIHCEIRKPKE